MGARFWAILILLLITTCSSARADNAGLSYLGLCNRTWECRESLLAFRRQKVIRTGWLENTFGARCPCADRILQSRKPKIIRVHIANGACLRNKRCGRYEIFGGQTIASAQRQIKRQRGRVVAQFKRVSARLRDRLAKSRGELTCYVSPVLESDFDGKARRVLHSLAANYLPGCSLVDNPVRGKCLPGYICEKHGEDPGLSEPCIADLDGAFVGRAQTRVFLRNTKACDIAFIWDAGMNCNKAHSATFIDPRKRNCVKPGGYYANLGSMLRREFVRR